jgi:hypothetical protein
MIMAFLLVVIVDNQPLKEEFFFRSVTVCNKFAYFVESGQVPLGQSHRKQKNISAYCIPRKISSSTKTWD